MFTPQSTFFATPSTSIVAIPVLRRRSDLTCRSFSPLEILSDVVVASKEHLNKAKHAAAAEVADSQQAKFGPVAVSPSAASASQPRTSSNSSLSPPAIVSPYPPIIPSRTTSSAPLPEALQRDDAFALQAGNRHTVMEARVRVYRPNTAPSLAPPPPTLQLHKDRFPCHAHLEDDLASVVLRCTHGVRVSCMAATRQRTSLSVPFLLSLAPLPGAATIDVVAGEGVGASVGLCAHRSRASARPHPCLARCPSCGWTSAKTGSVSASEVDGCLGGTERRHNFPAVGRLRPQCLTSTWSADSGRRPQSDIRLVRLSFSCYV